MAEALAAAAVALAAPPCAHAIAKIWVKVAGTLHLSSPAQCTYLLSRIRRLINKSRAELEKGSRAMSPDMVKDYGDKLNKNIKLYNQLVTSHYTANTKARLDSLKTAQKASARLLNDIRICSQKCADEKLVQAVKTCLDYDENIRSPDGTIAAYQSHSVHSQDLQHPTDTAVAHIAANDPEPTQTSRVLSLVPASESVINGRMNSPPRFSFQVEDPQLPSTGYEVHPTTTSAKDDVPLIDLDSTRISEVISRPEGDSS
ncbi:hypothetical protein DL96DRAFT_636913 [Flagelloscypha sp. PMI_526]|nr:hypothetical protein DL96DRAFT_636913 [Flagelloscypha sp. PMI_526]